MNGAVRLHHRNIYCIIYSASPLDQGESTHINFQPRSSLPHSGSCLRLKAEAPTRLLSFILFPRGFFSGSMRHREHPSGPPGLHPARAARCEGSTFPHLYFFNNLSCFSSSFFCFCFNFTFIFLYFYTPGADLILPMEYQQEIRMEYIFLHFYKDIFGHLKHMKVVSISVFWEQIWNIFCFS